jgi:uncharacterized surface protein with fasciclin (FAS1) repeats
MTKTLALTCALAIGLGSALTACSNDGGDAGEPSVGNETLASALADGDSVREMSDALKDTGLAQVFDGSAAYTVLAPSNEALSALEDQNDLSTDEGRAVLAAVLREHVLPGALTPDDIENAIAVQKGTVSIRTMGEGAMRFAMDGSTLTVTDESGKTAQVNGDAILASNGVVIPIDGVLKQP